MFNAIGGGVTHAHPPATVDKELRQSDALASYHDNLASRLFIPLTLEPSQPPYERFVQNSATCGELWEAGLVHLDNIGLDGEELSFG